MDYSIKHELETQDNRATSYPMFTVQNKEADSGEWHIIDVFFTQKGADKYIENEKWHYEKLRVYVASGCRNPEWQRALKMFGDDNF